MVCKKFLVSGKVQGVWYRGSTQKQAVQLGLRGSAVNLPDGRVEVIACGEGDKVAELERWLWQGPQLAKVTGIDVQTLVDSQADHLIKTLSVSEFTTG